MKLTPLKDVIEIHYGEGLKSDFRDDSYPYPVFGANGVVGRYKEYIVDHESIVIGRKGSCGEITLANPKFWPIDTTFYTKIKEASKLSTQYLYYALKAVDLKKLIITTSIPGINRDALYNVKVFVPNKTTQEKIVNVLRLAESAFENRRQTIRLADEFLKSAFLDMFGDYLYGQKQCDNKPIGKVSNFIDYRGKTPNKADSGIPLITAKNVRRGFISEEPREYILAGDYSSWMTRGFPKKGDVLFTTEAPLGNAAILGKYDKVVVGQRIITIQCSERLKSEFLLYCLLSNPIQSEIVKRSTGSTATGIRSKEFEKILIPLPPIELQQKFSDLVQKVEGLKAKQKQSETELQNLFNSLMQRAFKGEMIS